MESIGVDAAPESSTISDVDPKDMTTLGQILRARREERGWYQRDIQIKTGLSSGTVRAIERGAPVRHENREKYVALFGVSIDQLLHRDRSRLDADDVLHLLTRMMRSASLLVLLAQRLEADPEFEAVLRSRLTDLSKEK